VGCLMSTTLTAEVRRVFLEIETNYLVQEVDQRATTAGASGRVSKYLGDCHKSRRNTDDISSPHAPYSSVRDEGR